MGENQIDLIDTQWNVNLVANVDGNNGSGDLIDTQWNVNAQQYYIIKDQEAI